MANKKLPNLSETPPPPVSLSTPDRTMEMRIHHVSKSTDANNSGKLGNDAENPNEEEHLLPKSQTGCIPYNANKMGGLSDMLKAGQKISKVYMNILSDDVSDNNSDSMSKLSFCDSVFVKAPVLVLWVVVSLGLHMVNKTVIGERSWNFPAPLLYTTFQLAMEGLLAALCLAVSPQLRQFTRFEQETNMGIRQYLFQYGITGSATAFDIGLSNLALVYISIPVLAIIKASTPLFLLSFAFIFRIERPSLRLFIIMGFISVGLILTVEGELKLRLLGIVIAIGSAAVAGLRWNLMQLIMYKSKIMALTDDSSSQKTVDPESLKVSGESDSQDTKPIFHEKGASAGTAEPKKSKQNPIIALFLLYVCVIIGCILPDSRILPPIMSFTLLLTSMITEDPFNRLADSDWFATREATINSILIIACSGILASLLAFLEFQVLKDFGAVSFIVLGVVRKVLIIIAISLICHRTFSELKIVGFLCVIVGVLLYDLHRNHPA